MIKLLQGKIKLENVLLDLSTFDVRPKVTEQDLESYYDSFVEHAEEAGDYFAEIIEKIEGKKKLPDKTFFLLRIGSFDVTKIIVPLYRRIKEEKTKEKRQEMISYFRFDSPWYGFEEPPPLELNKNSGEQ